MRIFCSLLEIKSIDFGQYLKEIKFDGVHLDIMDGHAVPNIGLPLWIIPGIRAEIGHKPIQVHLMTNPTELFMEMTIRFRPNTVFFHPKWCKSPIDIAAKLQQHGIKVGIAWDYDNSEEYFEIADEILFMTVEPGRSGQKMILDRLEKIANIAPRDKLFWIDGGVNLENLKYIEDIKPTGVIVGKSIDSFGSYIT